MRRFVFLFLLATAAQAHDFWIEPSTFRPAPGQTVSLSLRVGQNFIGDPVPRSRSLIESFVVRDGAGERPVNGFEDRDPAGYIKVDGPGAAMVGYLSKPYPLELPAEKFNEFLQMEGFDRIRAERHRRGEDAKPDREQFSRFAKAVIANGGKKAPPMKAFGWRFEIVPETNPLDASPLRVRVLLDGKPAASALVTALHRDDPNAHVALRSDAKGRVTLPLPKAGVWLVKCVAIAPAKAGSGMDWETLWASLTFER